MPTLTPVIADQATQVDAVDDATPDPVMATAAKFTVASVHELAELGTLDPESIVTPGIFVSRIVRVPRVATQAGGFKAAA